MVEDEPLRLAWPAAIARLDRPCCVAARCVSCSCGLLESDRVASRQNEGCCVVDLMPDCRKQQAPAADIVALAERMPDDQGLGTIYFATSSLCHANIGFCGCVSSQHGV